MKNKKIIEFLMKNGVRPHIKGFKYMYDAIEFLMYHDNAKLTIDVYPEIAESHGTTWRRVERAIRHAINSSRGELKKKCPGEFFALAILEVM